MHAVAPGSARSRPGGSGWQCIAYTPWWPLQTTCSTIEGERHAGVNHCHVGTLGDMCALVRGRTCTDKHCKSTPAAIKLLSAQCRPTLPFPACNYWWKAGTRFHWFELLCYRCNMYVSIQIIVHMLTSQQRDTAQGPPGSTEDAKPCRGVWRRGPLWTR